MAITIFLISAGLIGYVYAGYPILVFLFAILRKEPKYGGEITPKVTLLVAAYNEEEDIKAKIENSLALDYPIGLLQIIIAADGSSDRTVEIANQFREDGIEVVYSAERRGKMAAINRAMGSVEGEIVVFSDANNMYSPDTLKLLIAPFSNDKIGATTGAKLIIDGDGNLGASEGLYWKYESFLKKMESRLASTTGVAGEILAVRKSVYQAPPDDIINDDFYIGMLILKKGYKLAYVPEAVSRERVSRSAQDEVTRRKRIIAGRYQAIARAFEFLPFRQPIVVWQIISHKFLRPLVPFAMIVALIANLAIFILPGSRIIIWGSVLVGQLVFYALAWVGSKLEDRELPGWLRLILYLPTFLVNSNIAALKGFMAYVQGRQTTRWERVQRR